MVGAVVAPSPSARFARIPTTVLAARHMRRASSLIQPQREGRPSADEEAAGPHRLSTSSGGGGGGAATALPDVLPGMAPAVGSGEPAAAVETRHLGTGLPAVAVSQQAGQQAEEVLLFFGIIDFLQVGRNVGFVFKLRCAASKLIHRLHVCRCCQCSTSKEHVCAVSTHCT